MSIGLAVMGAGYWGNNVRTPPSWVPLKHIEPVFSLEEACDVKLDGEELPTRPAGCDRRSRRKEPRLMRHSLQAEGEAFRLRPVSVDDAAFIVALRTDPVLGKYLHPTSPDIDDQRAWTKRYYERAGDWYFVVEQRATSERQGAVAIYNYDADQKTAEWGRWILKKGSLAALESAALIYDIGFDQLGLELMYSRTANKLVVSFNTRLGSTTEGLVIGPEGERWTETRMTSAQWHELRTGLEKKIAAAAAIANR